MANPPYPFRDRSRDHLAPWQSDDGIAYVDGKPGFIETWVNDKLQFALIYPATRKAVQALRDRQQAHG